MMTTTKRTTFTETELNTLRGAYATISTVNPAMLDRFHKLFDQCADDGLAQLVAARIKFVSKLAVNAQMRRKGVL
jgi:hypothetical protein